MKNILLCGFLGGLTTILGKLCFSGDNLILKALYYSCIDGFDFSEEICTNLTWIFRMIVFIWMILSNTLVFNYFLKAMETNNTVVVIVTSSATNFISTGLLGKFLFNEPLSPKWYLGSLLVVTGMCFVSASQGTFDSQDKANKSPPNAKI